MYTEKVMDHFSNPRNVGEIADANAVGTVGNAKCGDIMKIYMKIENDIIEDVKFKTFGCGAAVATSSMATELVKGCFGFSSASQATRRMLIKSMGEILFDELLPPTAPHPRVSAGNSPVVAPMPPKAAGVFTRNRETGICSANFLTTALSSAWMAKVWPLPSWVSTSMAFSSTASSLSITKNANTGHSFSME